MAQTTVRSTTSRTLAEYLGMGDPFGLTPKQPHVPIEVPANELDKAVEATLEQETFTLIVEDSNGQVVEFKYKMALSEITRRDQNGDSHKSETLFDSWYI